LIENRKHLRGPGGFTPGALNIMEGKSLYRFSKWVLPLR
jgi:hypothetical protein